jgi:hypothetical protein
MAKIQAKDVFNAGDLKMYNLCCEHYPKLMKYFEFNAQVQCFVKDNKTIDYCYVEVSGFDFDVKLFASLTIGDLFGKLALLNDFKKYIDKHDVSVNEAIHRIVEDTPRMIVIEKDIEEMIDLKTNDDIDGEYFDFEDSDSFDEGYERFDRLSNFKSKTVH